MAYRLEEHKPHAPRRTLTDISTPTKIYVQNGTIAHLAFPCLYQEVHMPRHIRIHNRHIHDWLGWPTPTHPDHICQVWVDDLHEPMIGFERHKIHPKKLIDLRKLRPIHLLSEYEGYQNVSIALNANPEFVDVESKLTVTGEIDAQDDWVIRVTIDARDETALHFPKRYFMSVFVEGPGRRDLAVLAEVIVLPSSYSEDDTIIDS